MKLVYYTYRKISLLLFVLMAVWGVLFYYAIIDEVVDETDDTLENYAESVWGDNIDQADSLDFIYSQVKNLRKKLKQADASVELKAVYGFGYKLSEL